MANGFSLIKTARLISEKPQRRPTILRTEKIVTNKFFSVPPEIASAEGEGDLSLEYWRKVHGELYTPYLKSWGVQKLEDATVITEFFKIVFK